MEIKDYIEISYWLISLAILAFTVYWIAVSPIKAVETGRKLDNEQNKYKAKSDLFLMLFSLRGNPTHHSFVNGLNQIDIVFEDSSEVLAAWGKLYDSLNNPSQSNAVETWALLRTELLSEMAQHLGYQKLKQTAIQRRYSPQAHAHADDDYYNYQQASKSFFESGTALNQYLLAHYQNLPEVKESNS
ncbi:hypothetical protein HNP24_002102 [Chryseobacterium sediminis]|uniref:DUF6680 domain-containing protein n=1 Tax=Chryseobacterium sediminis TaxID=1679494 RepID=A0ABR6PZT1_9FLAO|nr:DUF6680 family protein [Chryseobacterium sediminis]MBB6331152.1 hypothetical protein [Chryseobacterium sediminis]